VTLWFKKCLLAFSFKCLVHRYGTFWKPFSMWAKLSLRVRVIQNGWYCSLNQYFCVCLQP
jgi:hypothetical protein